MASKLDHTQVLPAAYDDTLGRLKVDASVSFPASQEVVISDVDDSIKIGKGDGVTFADVTASRALKVDGSAVTQPVSFGSLPLPTGASTEATLSTLNGKFTSTSAVITTFSSSLTSQQFLPSNASRKGAMLYNNTGQDCYVAFVATATTTAYTFILHSGSLYERDTINYTGAISGIWSATGSGQLTITELS